METYTDYGWEDSAFTDAHCYILSELVKMIPSKNDPILDIGCGNGAIANYLISIGYNVFGIDASKEGIDIANQVNSQRFYQQDFSKEDLPNTLKEIHFKTIISTEVIEHLYNPRRFIELCKNILEKSGGGHLIISTPYNGYFKNLAIAIFNGFDRHHTVLWDGGHIKFWSRNTLKVMLNEFSFKIIQFKGVGRFPLLWKSMIIKAEVK